MDILRNKKHATDRNWHWALDQYVRPKNNIKSCQKSIWKLNNIGMEQSKIIDTTETYQLLFVWCFSDSHKRKPVSSKLLFVLCVSPSTLLSYLIPKPLDPIDGEWRRTSILWTDDSMGGRTMDSEYGGSLQEQLDWKQAWGSIRSSVLYRKCCNLVQNASSHTRMQRSKNLGGIQEDSVEISSYS